MKKTRYILLSLFLLFYTCTPKLNQSNNPQFNSEQWRKNVLLELTKLSDSKRITYKFIDQDSKIIQSYVADDAVNFLLNEALKRNRLKNWTRCYVIYRLIESTTYYGFDTIVFFDGMSSDGTMFYRNREGYEFYKIGSIRIMIRYSRNPGACNFNL